MFEVSAKRLVFSDRDSLTTYSHTPEIDTIFDSTALDL